ncbi:MAG: succinate dehydrogenase/fumarate reductase iron-sulfur subunit [Euryarchaeota archaeon]|nr:succinate dehydrogenase/fumarate reductase iron-sulfur subunit [Euryarchaeota archaeon]MBV1754574.1 succinate dehydrogenase/fumarate reductase iron-sulfur subunit [Methanobacterium sp.]
MIKIKVLRFDSGDEQDPHIETYEIDKKEKMKVLDALNQINEKYEANIAFRSSCRAGQCGSCAIKMNKNVVLACKAEIEDDALLEPLDFPVIKDLIIDRSEIEEKVHKMSLFLDRGCDGATCPELISPADSADSKKLRGCIECFSCLSACPIIKESEEYAGPYFMRYLSKFALDPRDCDNREKVAMLEGLYDCTTCGKCAEVCPKEVSIPGDAIEKLRALSYRKKIGPLDPHQAVKKLVDETGRSIDPPVEGFIEAVNKVKADDESESKVAFFTGCMVDYRIPEVGFALLNVLKENNIDIIVPEKQVCCGSPLIRTGQLDVVDKLVKHNQQVFKGYDTIITVCAGCGATLKKDYPKYGVNFNVVDISEFLMKNLDTEKMHPVPMRVTYHDPCHLSRGQGITIEPREILKKIKGLEFVEMEEPNQCCGAGGGVKSGRPELAYKLGKKKAEMIKKLNVDAVISICPFCQYHIQDTLQKEGLGNIKVMNILELLDMAYKGPSDDKN